jgi:hypothetical protein
MAEIISDFKSNKGRPALYPWTTWADGKSRKIRQGDDFFSSLTSMRTMIHRKASEFGLKARVLPVPEENALCINFYDPKDTK